MPQNKYLISDDGMFYRQDQGGQYFRHSGDVSTEKPVENGNDGLDKVISGESAPITPAQYQGGVDPFVVR